MTWSLSSSSDRRALDIVDGVGRFSGHGPHYSRRTPGSRTFTGVGQEIVLVTDSAVWAVVRQRTPAARGTGKSRGRVGTEDTVPRYVWRNMVFRNLGRELSSALILDALAATYREWANRYGQLPVEVLRTEIDPDKIRGTNPGCCYKKAGFHTPRMVRGKLYLDAPCPTLVLSGECSCCPGSSLNRRADNEVRDRNGDAAGHALGHGVMKPPTPESVVLHEIRLELGAAGGLVGGCEKVGCGGSRDGGAGGGVTGGGGTGVGGGPGDGAGGGSAAAAASAAVAAGVPLDLVAIAEEACR